MATLQATCHCKAITITFPPPSEALNECLCTICRRYGALWAYYSSDQVQVSGEGKTDIYMWAERETEFHRCKTCGCVTHWASADKARKRVGINCQMLDKEVLDTLEREVSLGP